MADDPMAAEAQPAPAEEPRPKSAKSVKMAPQEGEQGDDATADAMLSSMKDKAARGKTKEKEKERATSRPQSATHSEVLSEFSTSRMSSKSFDPDALADSNGSLKSAINDTKKRINKLRSVTARLYRVDNEEMLKNHKRIAQEFSTLKRLELEQDQIVAKMKFYDNVKKRTVEIKAARQDVIDTAHQEDLDRKTRFDFLHTEAQKMRVAFKEQREGGIKKYKDWVAANKKKMLDEHNFMKDSIQKNEEDRTTVNAMKHERVQNIRRNMRASVQNNIQRNLDGANGLKHYKNTALKRVKDEAGDARDKTIENFRKELKRKYEEFKERLAQNLRERNDLVRNMGAFQMHCKKTTDMFQDWRNEASRDNQDRFKKEWEKYLQRRKENLDERNRISAENRARLEADLADMRFRLEDLVRAVSAERAQAKMKAMREIELKELRKQMALEAKLVKDYEELHQRGQDDRHKVHDELAELDTVEKTLIEKIADMSKEAKATFQKLVELQIGTPVVKFTDKRDVPHGGIWDALKLEVTTNEAEPGFTAASGPIDPNSIPLTPKQSRPASGKSSTSGVGGDSTLDTTADTADSDLVAGTAVAPNTV